MKHLLLSLSLLCSASAYAQNNYTYTGALVAADPTIPGDRLLRDGTGSVCTTAKVYPGTSTGAGVHYRTFTVTNRSLGSACITATLTHGCSESSTAALIFGSVYTGSFLPSNLSTNYKGDMGTSPLSGTTASMGVTLTTGQTAVFVVSGITSASVCSAYTLALSSTQPLPVIQSTITDNTLSAYPNPVTDVLHITASKAGNYTLFNATGTAVRRIAGTEVSVSDLPGGVYILQHDDTKATIRVVKL